MFFLTVIVRKRKNAVDDSNKQGKKTGKIRVALGIIVLISALIVSIGWLWYAIVTGGVVYEPLTVILITIASLLLLGLHS